MCAGSNPAGGTDRARARTFSSGRLARGTTAQPGRDLRRGSRGREAWRCTWRVGTAPLVSAWSMWHDMATVSSGSEALAEACSRVATSSAREERRSRTVAASPSRRLAALRVAQRAGPERRDVPLDGVFGPGDPSVAHGPLLLVLASLSSRPRPGRRDSLVEQVGALVGMERRRRPRSGP